MELKQINEILSDLSASTLRKKFNLVESNEPRDYFQEKSHGENEEKRRDRREKTRRKF